MEEASGESTVQKEPSEVPVTSQTSQISRSKSVKRLKSSVTSAFEEVDEADFAGGGLGQLHDLAIRSQSKSNKALTVVAWVRRQCRLLSDITRVQMVIQILYREQLLSLVHGAIVKESKARKMLPKTSPERFLHQVRFILHVEHERSCIDSMVENWAMMQRMLNFKETSDCSHLNERVEKVSSFWGERVSNSPKRSNQRSEEEAPSFQMSRAPSRPATADAGFEPPCRPAVAWELQAPYDAVC